MAEVSSWTNLFLTGPPGAGKTTILFRALRRLDIEAGGYVVKRVYRYGRLWAMDVVDLSGAGRACLIDLRDPARPEINRDAFLTIGAPAIRRAMSIGLVVMDEIGRFELAVPVFLDAVKEALDSGVPVTGVLKEESNWFLDRVRSRADVRVVRVEPASRQAAEVNYTRLLLQLLTPRWIPRGNGKD